MRIAKAGKCKPAMVILLRSTQNDTTEGPYVLYFDSGKRLFPRINERHFLDRAAGDWAVPAQLRIADRDGGRGSPWLWDV
jgi:hypothetical protein